MKIIHLILFNLLFVTVFAQQEPVEIKLWSQGAPGFEKLKNEPEEAKDYYVKNVNNPSITAYYPATGRATGAAALVFPGGGHRLLVINSEGRDAAKYLNSLGITAFVLKYRLAREENSPYELGVHCVEDAERAMRVIRSRAGEFGIDTAKVGIMGFSAGGEVAHWMAYGDGTHVFHEMDEIDKLSSKPNFQILVYPGPLGVPEVVPSSAPITFAAAATDDECCSEPLVQLLTAYRNAGVPYEMHLYAAGGHAFNMGQRTKIHSLATWSDRLTDWLVERGLGTIR